MNIHVIPPESSGRLPEMELISRAPGKDAKNSWKLNFPITFFSEPSIFCAYGQYIRY